MKTTKKLLACSVAAASLAISAVAPVAQAEVAASVGIASTYLWRGLDLGTGTPAVSGDLSYSTGGAYGGVWASSGDTSSGTEYDLYVGYGGEIGGISYDVSLWNYLYPTGEDDMQEDQFGDLSEFVLSLGAGPVSLTLYENIANSGGNEDYRYVTLGAEAGKYSVLVGAHLNFDPAGKWGDAYSAEGDFVGTAGGKEAANDAELLKDVFHLDISYAYNDNLSFTLSQVFEDDEDSVDDDLKFVVSYSIPLE